MLTELRLFAEFVSRYPTLKIIYVLSIYGFHVQALPFILTFLHKKRAYPYGFFFNSNVYIHYYMYIV